jgi:N-acetylneuraminic acid mutarotase
MDVARYVPGIAALPDGTVMVVGGGTCCPYGEVNEAEIYDPATNDWTPTADKVTPAEGATVLLRKAGKVLVAGGWTGTQPNNQVVKAAELFDTTSMTWSRTKPMLVPREGPTMTRIPGRQMVLVAGGNNGGWGVCNVQTSAEVYRVGGGDWRSAGDMTDPRHSHDAVRLADGNILIAGGQDCAGNVWASAELYEP